MKTAMIRYAAALLALAVFAIGVPSADASPVHGPAQRLSEQVRKELVTLPWYGVFDILSYRVNGSVVTLEGYVTSEHAVTKDDAENAVRRVPGVTKVVNHIHILPPLPFDNQIRRAEYHAIFSRGDLGMYTLGVIPQIHIIVQNGHVTLEGTVINDMDRNMAGLAANSVPGVFSVTNNLHVERG